MENLLKGILFSFITIVVICVLSIVVVPWLYNWIVFIWTSPLPAGEATRVYLFESIEAVSPFILLAIFFIMVYHALVGHLKSNYTEHEYDFMGNHHSPTLAYNVSKTAPVAPPEQKSDPLTDRGGETVIVTEHTENGGTFHHVKRNSPEYQAIIKRNAEKQRGKEVDEINDLANQRLKEVFVKARGQNDFKC